MELGSSGSLDTMAKCQTRSHLEKREVDRSSRLKGGPVSVQGGKNWPACSLVMKERQGDSGVLLVFS